MLPLLAMGENLARPDRLFGRYEVLEFLGSGAMSDVFLAVHLGLRKRVALKVLRQALRDDRAAIQRFQREGEWAARVTHPNVVDVTDFGTHDGMPYLVMELLQGETLADKLRREGPLPVAQAVDLMLPLMDGVSAIHAAGVLHRDIKPANVLLTRSPDGRLVPKLVDFGVATGEERRHITGATGPIGTPHYMSPEQAQGRRDLDQKSDQYALASILYECLTGREPFAGKDVGTVLCNVSNGRFPEARALSPEVPPELDAVLARATARDRDRRFANVHDFAHALSLYASRRARELWRARRPLGSTPESKSGVWRAPIGLGRAHDTHFAPQPSVRGVRAVLALTATLVLGVVLGTQLEPRLAVARTSSRGSVTAEPAPQRTQVTPADAEVLFDGRMLGRGPFEAPVLDDGALHELRVRAPGFVTRVALFRGRYSGEPLALEPLADRHVSQASLRTARHP